MLTLAQRPRPVTPSIIAIALTLATAAALSAALLASDPLPGDAGRGCRADMALADCRAAFLKACDLRAPATACIETFIATEIAR